VLIVVAQSTKGKRKSKQKKERWAVEAGRRVIRPHVSRVEAVKDTCEAVSCPAKVKER
jgi:hypothetical protein